MEIAVVSLIGGAVLTQAGGWLQHRRTRRDTAEDRRHSALDARKARQRQLTDEALQSLLDEMSQFRTRLHSDDQISDSELHVVSERVDRLTQPIGSALARALLQQCSIVLWYSDVMSGQASGVPSSANVVASQASAYVSELAGALLREDDELPSPPAWFDEAVAWIRYIEAGNEAPSGERAAPA